VSQSFRRVTLSTLSRHEFLVLAGVHKSKSEENKGDPDKGLGIRLKIKHGKLLENIFKTLREAVPIILFVVF